MSLLSHYWTISPRLRHAWKPLPAPETRPWETAMDDPWAGRVRISGFLREEPGADELLVLVHGLGGSTESHYMLRGARAARAAGLSCLRINLRGCDRQGGDYYHAGLTADLHAAFTAEDLRNYRRIYLIGYSLGGHVVLRLATEEGDRRIAAVAAVCAPIDLARSQEAIDSPPFWLYRRYLLASLNDIYTVVAARRAPRPVPFPVERLKEIKTLRDWDERIVAPRHGFTGASDYYARASVAPRLADLRVPALLLNSESDPMVPAWTVRPALERSAPKLEVHWVRRGGHVAFPRWARTGLGEGSVDEQLIGWLRRVR